mgnify:CR=1 FL=1
MQGLYINNVYLHKTFWVVRKIILIILISLLTAGGFGSAHQGELSLVPFTVRWSCGSSDPRSGCEPRYYTVDHIEPTGKGRVNLIYQGEIIANVSGDPEYLTVVHNGETTTD